MDRNHTQMLFHLSPIQFGFQIDINYFMCGCLNENTPDRLIGRGTIRRYVGIIVILLEEVCQWQRVLRFKKL